ncbi:MAG TPA: hypothetical protein VN848_02000 [Gemmatimonadales bacterium]|nr:hypothetical protein [Gemmatimonadales bacterium]
MKYTAQEFTAAARVAAARARSRARRLFERADAALIYAGDAARRRQRRRAASIALRFAARAVLVAGTAAIGVAAARALRSRKPSA